jgi:hypothetical protein
LKAISTAETIKPDLILPYKNAARSGIRLKSYEISPVEIRGWEIQKIAKGVHKANTHLRLKIHIC